MDNSMISEFVSNSNNSHQNINLPTQDDDFVNKDIPIKQEQTRSQLAKGFSILFGLVLLIYIGYAIFGTPNQEKNTLLSIILSATTGFVGTILGFYFGQNSKK